MPVNRALRWGLLALVLALVSWSAPSAQAQAPGVQRVVILPFAVNAQSDVSFLVKGVRDMLATRLAWQDRVVVMEPDLVAPAASKYKPPLTDERARALGKELSAQVVVFGSMTVLGKAVSVDARVVKVGGGEPLTAFVQAADMDGVIPGVNNFAQRINAEIFQRPDAVAAQKKAEGETVRAVEASKAPMETSDDAAAKLPETMSPLNPLFMRTLTGVDSDRYWRSPRIDGAITSIAVADIDNDGKNELLVLLPNALRVYRLAGDHFALLREFKNGPGGTYLFVDVADVSGSGVPQIFVSNRYRQTLHSFVLQWSEGKGLTMVAKDLPYFFRVQKNPVGQGDLLLAQKTVVDEAFFGPVWQMKWQGKELVPEREIPMPQAPAGNIYSTLLADLNGSGKPMTAMVSLNYSLKVFNAGGEEAWVSAEAYAAGGKFFELMPAAGQGYEPLWYYLPIRMVTADLDGDGRQEVIVVRNADRADGMLAKMRMFYQGTIFGLYWNGMSLVEQWRTPNISGYVADLAIADVGNVGKPALVMAVGQRHMKGFFEADTSHVVAFTLKPPKPPKVGGGL